MIEVTLRAFMKTFIIAIFLVIITAYIAPLCALVIVAYGVLGAILVVDHCVFDSELARHIDEYLTF